MKSMMALASALVLSFSVPALADWVPPGWLSPTEVTSTLEKAGYTSVSHLDSEDGFWEGVAVHDGKIVKFLADPKTGKVVREHAYSNDPYFYND
jgi:hypothetical protein